MPVNHLLDPRRLAGGVDVVSPEADAGIDNGCAVERKWSRGGEDDSCGRHHCVDGFLIGYVSNDNVDGLGIFILFFVSLVVVVIVAVVAEEVEWHSVAFLHHFFKFGPITTSHSPL